MNATFDLKESLKLLRLLKTGRGPGTQWLRVTAIKEFLIFEAGQGVVWVPALVLEPGAFSTRRTPFNKVLASFTGSKTLTLQADAGRFRINSFSGQILDYDPKPKRPKGFEPIEDESESTPPGDNSADATVIAKNDSVAQPSAPKPLPPKVEDPKPAAGPEGAQSGVQGSDAGEKPPAPPSTAKTDDPTSISNAADAAKAQHYRELRKDLIDGGSDPRDVTMMTDAEVEDEFSIMISKMMVEGRGAITEDPELLKDAAIVAAKYIQAGIRDVGAFAAKWRKEIGHTSNQDIFHIWNAGNEEHAKSKAELAKGVPEDRDHAASRPKETEQLTPSPSSKTVKLSSALHRKARHKLEASGVPVSKVGELTSFEVHCALVCMDDPTTIEKMATPPFGLTPYAFHIAIELGIQTVEKGGTLAQAVSDAIDGIRELNPAAPIENAKSVEKMIHACLEEYGKLTDFEKRMERVIQRAHAPVYSKLPPVVSPAPKLEKPIVREKTTDKNPSGFWLDDFNLLCGAIIVIVVGLGISLLFGFQDASLLLAAMTGFGVLWLVIWIARRFWERTARSTLARALEWIRRNLSSSLVIFYALIVVGSLFCAPWEGWKGQADKRYGGSRITRYGPIFSPPESLPVSPRLKSEEIALVWGALGVATFAGVYLSKQGKAGAATGK
jgi:hypothetical protein